MRTNWCTGQQTSIITWYPSVNHEASSKTTLTRTPTQNYNESKAAKSQWPELMTELMGIHRGWCFLKGRMQRKRVSTTMVKKKKTRKQAWKSLLLHWNISEQMLYCSRSDVSYHSSWRADHFLRASQPCSLPFPPTACHIHLLPVSRVLLHFIQERLVQEWELKTPLFPKFIYQFLSFKTISFGYKGNSFAPVVPGLGVRCNRRSGRSVKLYLQSFRFWESNTFDVQGWNTD